MEDETGFTFPAGVRVIALPAAVSLQDGNLHYSARYRRMDAQDNMVLVQRRLTFRHDGMVCTPAEYQRMQPLLDRIMRDLKSQVIIKGPAL